MARPEWLFDDSPIADPLGHGERAVDFLRSLRHPKSRAKGRAFQLDSWVERLVRRIYGPRDEDGQRTVRTVFAMIPRGNRKTSIGAALVALHTFGPERIPNGQVVSAAADAKQALIAYDEMLGIVRAMPAVERALDIRVGTHKIRHPRKGATYESISSDGATQHGRTINFLLSDEIHAWKKRDLWEALKTSLAKTAESLHVITTTAGRGEDNLAHDLVTYARKVASGEVEDPTFLPVLFEPDEGDDWLDEAVWHKVNPGLSLGYPDLKGLRAMAREVEARPADRESFRQYHLNVWLDSSAAPFVDMATYDAGAAPLSDEDMAGPCWLAADLSSSVDLSVIAAVWRKGDGYVVKPWFFCPEDNLRERQDSSGSPYLYWAEQGLIEVTPGNVIDHRRIEARIRELCRQYRVQEIAFDPALAGQVMSNLSDDGFPVVEFRQGSLTMMPAIAELERAVIARRLQHGGHPVLRMNFANVEVETNSHGHQTRLKKARRWSSIDGAVACAMAVQRASVGEGRSVYESRGVLTV